MAGQSGKHYIIASQQVVSCNLKYDQLLLLCTGSNGLGKTSPSYSLDLSYRTMISYPLFSLRCLSPTPMYSLF